MKTYWIFRVDATWSGLSGFCSLMNGTQQERQRVPIMPIDWEEKQKEPRLNFKSQWKCFLKWKGYAFNGMLRGYYTQRGRKCMLNRLCIDDTTKGHWNRKNIVILLESHVSASVELNFQLRLQIKAQIIQYILFLSTISHTTSPMGWSTPGSHHA